MNIPQFPSHDLAKLVLGYLAEEQLMTAYDEFLSASPYLDPMKNEYDRIFMTSLKNILAEYRAVKIYLETCKPYTLRRRLLGCTNLFDIVKFLVQNVDVNKLQVPEGRRGGLGGQPSCAVCTSLRQPSCTCTNRYSLPFDNQTNVKVNSSGSSTETTALEDLPGNVVTVKKKQVKTLPKQSRVPQFMGSDSSSFSGSEGNVPAQFDSSLPNNSLGVQGRPRGSTPGAQNHNAQATSNVVQNMEPTHLYNSTKCRISCTDKLSNQRVVEAGTFQDFTAGVQGDENNYTSVPVSSSSENASSQYFSSKECRPNINNSVKSLTKAHIFLTVGTIQTSTSSPCINQHPTNQVMARPRTGESKVTILSDVKVDKSLPSQAMPPVLSTATSTPLMHMQTILINGTPVYKPQQNPTDRYSTDEIMAMPTIFLQSGESQVPARNHTDMPYRAIEPPPNSIAAAPLEPLVIDVPSSSPLPLDTDNNMPLLDLQRDNETEVFVKSVDTKMVSAPRDGAGPARATPLMAPPPRKSSSTPRRTSHVRVLDFATPRRILQESKENTGEGNAPIEVVISKSPNLHTLAVPEDEHTMDKVEDNTGKAADGAPNSSGSSKENEKSVQGVPTKKANWDADLRAAAIANKKEDIPKSNIAPRCRPRVKIEKSDEEKTIKSKDNKKNKGKKAKKSANKSTCKENSSKVKNNKRKPDKNIEEPIIVVDDNSPILKPNINIITKDWSIQENNKNQNNKSNNSKNSDQTDTPEMDRLSLQNAIGAKLNISDLLETPYKQALYDIQMETPRFLGPDLPDAPLSDIKIMNIPTPRFLDTPKPLSATPSSYSSRPTDYSSGGSYYKPDDQDYLPLEDLRYAVTATKETEVEDAADGDETEKAQSSKSKPRPVRKCAKNVSYYNTQVNSKNKNKEPDEKLEKASICSDTMSINSSTDKKSEIDSRSNFVKENKPKTKRNSISKKHKTPTKRDTSKTFMKIKPRRVTPMKETVKGKARSRKSEGESRKKKSSKEKSTTTHPVLSFPTKSRRKSSTPRKLHCTKNYNTESSDHELPDIASKTKDAVVDHEERLMAVQDSDNEQIPLHWSDEGSQDVKPDDCRKNSSVNESEDISKIKEFIASEGVSVSSKSNVQSNNLHDDLVKRGFDTETAKIIERDLLDSPADQGHDIATSVPLEEAKNNRDEAELEKTIESDTSSVLKIVQEEDEEFDEIELGESECHEGTDNYVTCCHDDLKNMPRVPAVKLKDKFSVEVCIDDGVTVRLRATPITTLLDQDPHSVATFNEEETERAVNSISHIDKLYTPMKDPDLRAQVYDIFESTLTSLDTPLKAQSPKRMECNTTVTEVILEVEEVEVKERPDKKRKRLHSAESNDSANSCKRTRPDPQDLLKSTKIQNFDIETVLSKLHGP